MIAVVQRVLEARVTVEGKVVGEIGAGMLVLVAVEVGDEAKDVAWMASKLLTMRIFAQGDKYFDLDLAQMAAAAGASSGILLVSNFTVAADTSSGRRPSLSNAAPPAQGRELFDALVAEVRKQAGGAGGTGVRVETGAFGADMRVSLVNDGPVTFLVQSREES